MIQKNADPERLRLKASVFSPSPSVADLNSIGSSKLPTGLKIRIRIWQNHSASSFGMFAKKYAEVWGATLEINDVGYDDSFSWHQPGAELEEYDFHLVWVDADRILASGNFNESWFADRINHLAANVGSSVLVVVSSKNRETALTWSKFLLINTEALVVDSWLYNDETLSPNLVVAKRLEKVTGSYLTASRTLQIARQVVCQIILLSKFPPIKLVVVDLDWTMYAGVLREEGPRGVQFHLEHKRLWSLLRAAKRSGVMLGIVSRNETQLVDEFFEARSTELGIELDDFIGVETLIRGTKSSAVKTLIELARTTPRDAVFIDDNIGELAYVLSELPELKAIIGNMEMTTVEWLRNTPGINWNRIDPNAETRIKDIQARKVRGDSARENDVDAAEFLSQLDIGISLSVNNIDHLPRLSDMIQRTNQFNSNSIRRDPSELVKLSEKNSTYFLTAGLRDAFVDSGIIFGLLCRTTDDEQLETLNLVLSCRAMGRGIEPVIVAAAFEVLMESAGVTSIRLPWASSERNLPFREFVAQIQNIAVEDLPNEGEVTLTLDQAKTLKTTPIRLTIETVN